MARTIPIYKDHDETYRADSCGPLAEAYRTSRIKLKALCHGHYPGTRLPEEAMHGVKMLGFWDAPEDQDWGLGWHRNEGMEVAFVERGHLIFGADGHEYRLEADDMTVTRPWQLHKIGDPSVGASRLAWLIIDLGVRRPHQEWTWPHWLLLSAPDRNELTNILRGNEQPVWRGTPQLRRCWQEISETLDSARPVSNISRLTVRLNDLFLLLLDMLRENKPRLDDSLTSSRRTVHLFLNDLKAHPENLAIDWGVEEMATSCGLGVSQFMQHVRRLTNMTPVQFLTHCRLELAARLLREQRAAHITDIALDCGFASSQYFATVFSRHYGCSPREFRASRAS